MKRVIVSKFNYLFLILEKFYLTVFMKDYIHNIILIYLKMIKINPENQLTTKDQV